MLKTGSKLCSLLIIVVLFIQVAACGTVIYPERRGQTRGDIDPGVVILDSIGILFFVVPGLVSFIVDFATGAIYLPPGKTSEQRLKDLKGSYNYRIQEKDGRLAIFVDPGQLTPELVETIIRTTTGIDYNTTDPELKTFRLDGPVCLSEQYQVADYSHTAFSQLN